MTTKEEQNERVALISKFSQEIFKDFAESCHASGFLSPFEMPNVCVCLMTIALVTLRNAYPEPKMLKDVSEGAIAGLLHSLPQNGFSTGVAMPSRDMSNSGTYFKKAVN